MARGSFALGPPRRGDGTKTMDFPLRSGPDNTFAAEVLGHRARRLMLPDGAQSKCQLHCTIKEANLRTAEAKLHRLAWDQSLWRR